VVAAMYVRALAETTVLAKILFGKELKAGSLIIEESFTAIMLVPTLMSGL